MIADTASKTNLLLQCGRPFSAGVETHDEPGEAAIYGTAWHTALERLANTLKGGELPPLHEPISEDTWGHARRSFAALQKWILGGNQWGSSYRVESAERHLATRLVARRDADENRYYGARTRITEFDPETHRYDLRPNEFGGTPDLILVRRESSPAVGPHRIVLDHKSGLYHSSSFTEPSTMGQMLTLALMTSANAVAILHHPADGVPMIYAQEVTPLALRAHAKARLAAMRRIGDGSMRPGPECSHCPARDGCPANDGELLVRASSLVRTGLQGGELAKPVDPGHLHQMLGELDRLAKRARELIREDVRAGAEYTRPDGKRLVLRPKSYETLSKSSVLEALGKDKGEKELTRLRKLGAIRSDTREELHAIADKGGR